MAGKRLKYRVIGVFPELNDDLTPIREDPWIKRENQGGGPIASYVTYLTCKKKFEQLKIPISFLFGKRVTKKWLKLILEEAVRVPNRITIIILHSHGGFFDWSTYVAGTKKSVTTRHYNFRTYGEELTNKKSFFLDEDIRDLLDNAKSRVLIINTSCHSENAAFPKNSKGKVNEINGRCVWEHWNPCKENERSWYNTSIGAHITHYLTENWVGNKTFDQLYAETKKKVAEAVKKVKSPDKKDDTGTMCRRSASVNTFFVGRKIPVAGVYNPKEGVEE